MGKKFKKIQNFNKDFNVKSRKKTKLKKNKKSNFFRKKNNFCIFFLIRIFSWKTDKLDPKLAKSGKSMCLQRWANHVVLLTWFEPFMWFANHAKRTTSTNRKIEKSQCEPNPANRNSFCSKWEPWFAIWFVSVRKFVNPTIKNYNKILYIIKTIKDFWEALFVMHYNSLYYCVQNPQWCL